MSIRRRWFTLVQIAYDLTLKMNPRKLAAHAVIQDTEGRVLLLRSRYADRWALPGGGVDRRENLDATVMRECREELGVTVSVGPMTGMYYHVDISVYMAIFRCTIPSGTIRLSHEHSELRWSPLAELPLRIRQVVDDALAPDGATVLRTFG